jgi:4-hydroxythreonine-4-phosphate dehydrogenase
VAPADASAGVHRQEALSQPRHIAPIIALTSGEPAGIGPDICIQLAFEKIDARLAVYGDPAVFKARAKALGIDLAVKLLDDIADSEAHLSGRLQLLPVEHAQAVTPGELDPANASAVIAMLDAGTEACVNGTADALVTAPVQKSVINEAGIPFSGHTEYLGKLTGAKQTVMLLASPTLRVALATTHLPLAGVPAAITLDRLTSTIRIIDRDLKHRFGFERPRIMVLGLNPHAGESGVLGSEEQTTIEPAIAELARGGIDVFGPVSADSAFTEASLRRCDVVLAMYHDQGLSVLKSRDFGEIVNVTLGLPIIRTSVDHGTALTLAGTGVASHASLRAAVDLAIELTARHAR